ncbi:MAG: hypothetical protein WEA10_05015 [Actinomycetota bacterium]
MAGKEHVIKGAPLDKPIDNRSEAQVAADKRAAERRAKEPQPQLHNAPSVLAKARQESMGTLARDTLNAIATSPVLQTGQALHAEDRAQLLKTALADLDGAPPRLKGEAKLLATSIISAIEKGDRQAAEQQAHEGAFELGRKLAASAFEAPEGPDPEALAAMIKRG